MVFSISSLNGQTALAVIVGTIFLDQIGVPVPADPVLVVAGAAAVNHGGWGIELFVCATAACMVADTGWFLAGRIYGSRVMRLLCRISLTPDSCVSDTQLRFERWGWATLVVAKFIPGLSIIAPPLAGALRVSWIRFLGLSALGAALWVAFFLCVGAAFHSQIDWLLPLVARYGGWAMLALGASFACFIFYKWLQRRRFYLMLRMARINVAELYELMQSLPAPHVVDVRSQSARNLNPLWIPGARHLQLDQMSTHVGDLSRDRDVVLYCSCPNEASAARVAKMLIDLGFTRVRPLHGGLEAWVAAGYPVEQLPVLESAVTADARTASPIV